MRSSNDVVDRCLDAGRNLRHAERTKLRAARDLLLPRLMSGEIAV